MKYAILARDTHCGTEQVLHRFAGDREAAAEDIRTPVSAFAIDEDGRVALSSHVPQPPSC